MGRLLPAALAVGLVLLAGCSGDDDPEPKISPTDSSSVASTPTPSPTPSGPVEPTMPAEAEGEDAAAAEAFVRFYWEMVNYAQATGNVTGLSAVAATSCAACASGLDGIVDTYAAGGSISGGRVSVENARAREISSRSGSAFSVEVTARVNPQTISEPGQRPEKFDGGPVNFKIVVRSNVDGWKIMRVDVVK